MSKRLSFYGLVALASVCIFFLAFNQRYSSYLEHRLQPMISVSTKFGGGDCSKLSHAKHALSEDGKSLTFAPKKKKPSSLFIHFSGTTITRSDARGTDTATSPSPCLSISLRLYLSPPSFHASFPPSIVYEMLSEKRQAVASLRRNIFKPGYFPPEMSTCWKSEIDDRKFTACR